MFHQTSIRRLDHPCRVHMRNRDGVRSQIQYLQYWNPFTSDTAITTINTNPINTSNNDPFYPTRTENKGRSFSHSPADEFPLQSALEPPAGTQTRRLCRWRALSEVCRARYYRGRPGAVLTRRGHGRGRGRGRACGRGRILLADGT